MDLQHIALSDLSIASVNVRHGRKPPDVSDILPSIRARGVLQPLLVRRCGGSFEVVAGRRRFFAAMTIAQEQGTPTDEVVLPCAVMGKTDDAAAMEASLIENVARTPMDELQQYEAFARLVKQGRSTAEIAETFGVTELTVKRRLALANLHPKIRDAYRSEAIEQEDLKLLTAASKRQQKEWIAAFEAERDPDNEEVDEAPRGYHLRQWLFGGEQISTAAALFPVEAYKGALITDLFGEVTCFADHDAFWALQNEAIARLRDDLIAKGWGAAVVLERGAPFRAWQHVAASMENGGKVFIEVRTSGEVDVHEGYVEAAQGRHTRHNKRVDHDDGDSRDDAAVTAAPKYELTKTAENYLALHRHAIVRTELLQHPGLALRLAAAHMIVGSTLWSVQAEEQRADKEPIAQSLRASAVEATFAAEREAILTLLGLEPSWSGTVVRPNGDPFMAASIFARLLALSDEEVLRVLALVMGETLAAGSALVEAAGAVIRPDVARWWQADDTFLDLIRDRRAVNAMLADVAGRAVADSHVSETAKVQKKIIRDCLAGEGRAQVDGWVPAYMAFPMRSYTDAGSKLAESWNDIAALFAPC